MRLHPSFPTPAPLDEISPCSYVCCSSAAHPETLGLYLVAALSNNALFSSISAKKAWFGDVFLKELSGGVSKAPGCSVASSMHLPCELRCVLACYYSQD